MSIADPTNRESPDGSLVPSPPSLSQVPVPKRTRPSPHPKVGGSESADGSDDRHTLLRVRLPAEEIVENEKLTLLFGGETAGGSGEGHKGIVRLFVGGVKGFSRIISFLSS